MGTSAFAGGLIDGDSLTWQVDATRPMPLTIECTATVGGDEITGEVTIGAFGSASFTGLRVGPGRQAMSFDGRWCISVKTPMGPHNSELDLTSEQGMMTGTMTDKFGIVEMSDGKVQGDTASWSASVREPMKLTLKFSATVEGDCISGKAKPGSFRVRRSNGERLAD